MSDEKIPLFKVLMSDDAPDRVADVLRSGYVGQGPQVDAFEQRLRDDLRSASDIVTVNSCTSALDLATYLAGVGEDRRDEPEVVVSTPMTCSATNSPPITRGALVAWADVDPVTGNIDPASVGDAIRDLWRTEELIPKAVYAVDWSGRLCDYVSIRREIDRAVAETGVERPRAIPIIQDAAHAYGAFDSNGRPFLSGTERGSFTCFSFQAIKHLTTVDGGALVCVDAAMTERARLLRWYGLDRTSGESFRCSQDIMEVGWKYHMNDVAAAVGLANASAALAAVTRHRTNARRYHDLLGRYELAGVTLPPWDDGSSWWLFTLLVDDQAGFIAFMTERGIGASQVHRRNDEHAAFRARAVNAGRSLAGVDAFASHEVAVPVGWWLTDADIERIAAAIVDWSIRTHPAAYSYGPEPYVKIEAPGFVDIPAQTSRASRTDAGAVETTTEPPLVEMDAQDARGIASALATERLTRYTPEQVRTAIIRAGMELSGRDGDGVTS